MKKTLILSLLTLLTSTVIAQRFTVYSFGFNHPIKYSDSPALRKTGIDLGIGFGKFNPNKFSYEVNFAFSIWGRKNYKLINWDLYSPIDTLSVIDIERATYKLSLIKLDFLVSILIGYKLNRFELKNGLAFGIKSISLWKSYPLYLDPEAFDSKTRPVDWNVNYGLDYQLRVYYEINNKISPYIDFKTNLKKTSSYFNQRSYEVVTLGLILKIDRH